MAFLAPSPLSALPGLLAAGELWLPRASLASCLRAVIVRSTVGAALGDAQRINRFPATPACSLSWFFEGEPYALQPPDAAGPAVPGRRREPLPGRWMIGGPQTRPNLSRITRRITSYAPKALYDGVRGDESFWIYRLWT
ncbi:MAG: hypothetical protein QM674_23780 [Burkholderiaceae bacterium]